MPWEDDPLNYGDCDDGDDGDPGDSDDPRFAALVSLLWALDGVAQDPHYHPEGDALYHSLQVFAQAQAATEDPILWAAALFHDVGKAEGSQDHAARGAAWLVPWLPAHSVWLVAHHMDLLYTPRKTRQRLAHDPRLHDLQRLRRWDRDGRDPYASAMSPEDALGQLLNALDWRTPKAP